MDNFDFNRRIRPVIFKAGASDKGTFEQEETKVDYTSEEFWKGAPEGATHYMPTSEMFCEAWIKGVSDNSYAYIIIGDDNQDWDVATFSRPKVAMSFLVKRPRPKPLPVFTKAMSDAGELPQVGMECMYKDSHTGKYILVEVMYISEWAIVIRQVGEGYGKDVEIAKHISDVKLEPVDTRTDKEKAYDKMRESLEDGKAYNFIYHKNRKAVDGFYSADEDEFVYLQGTVRSHDASSIQPLTVADK